MLQWLVMCGCYISVMQRVHQEAEENEDIGKGTDAETEGSGNSTEAPRNRKQPGW